MQTWPWISDLPFPLHPPRKTLAAVRLFPLSLLQFADGAMNHGLGTFEGNHELPKTTYCGRKEHSGYIGKGLSRSH